MNHTLHGLHVEHVQAQQHIHDRLWWEKRQQRCRIDIWNGLFELRLERGEFECIFCIAYLGKVRIVRLDFVKKSLKFWELFKISIKLAQT